MRTEKEKMLAGELYLASDPQLVAERHTCRVLLKQFNDSPDDDIELRQKILGELIGAHGDNLWIEPPFYCDYGRHITMGRDVYFNFNCIVLDVAPVKIGDQTLFGPNVQIYTATHPLDWRERASGAEFAKPIAIGSNVWVGGGAILCPGITIGDRTVIGAGSVVTKNIPSAVFAAGNPCTVIRKLGDA
jgi:maltose O-acetyltransferase